MAYDENIRVISEELERLKNQIRNLDVEIPEHPSTDAGKILAVGSDGDLEWKTEYSYTPPAYSSTEEVNTGQKWIDGNDIYCKVLTGTFPELSQSATQAIATGIMNIKYINAIVILKSASGVGSINRSASTYTPSSGTVSLLSVSTLYSYGSYEVAIYYTKIESSTSHETKSKKEGAK